MFSKHFHMCFFKLKCPTATTATPPHPKHSSPPSSSSTSTTFLFSDDSSSVSSDSSAVPPPPDFSSLFSSHRFFFSSPGTSNSIFESPDTRPTSSASANNHRLLSRSQTAPPSPRGVEVPKYSSDPYVDFRCSMQEMIESRGLLVDVTRDRDYLHDLLLCYLSLNHPHNHRYILQAFTDLVVHLLSFTQTTTTQESTPQ